MFIIRERLVREPKWIRLLVAQVTANGQGCVETTFFLESRQVSLAWSSAFCGPGDHPDIVGRKKALQAVFCGLIAGLH
ncbi:hypothetical protein PQR75_38215 [Paraburkholderia fungorum]|uniref:hypothetical protein n=1 Tax=Paraburkholderia fungorum TaxID=134537 RepID=UPI0038B9FB0A